MTLTNAAGNATVVDRAARTPRGSEPPTPGPAERHAGQIVAERYQLLHPLGEGGMGSVWAAKHVQTRKRVALKFIKRSGRASPLARRRALREARAATVVQHPNIVCVHDIIEVDDSPMLVMDLIEGQSLGSYLARRGRLPLGEAAPILLRVVSAIGTASAAGVVHRDLKPDNILLVSLPAARVRESAAGSRSYDVRVLDFGLAKLTATEGDAATSGDLTRDGDVIGTPHYMAPEQAFGEHVDHRADIWSLGIIMYECLAGVRPFQGDNLGQVLKRLVNRQYLPLGQAAPELPDDVTALVDGMLAFERSARPADLRGAHAVLSRYADDTAPSFDLPAVDRAEADVEQEQDQGLEPPAAPAPVRRRAARSTRWLAAAGTALAVAAGAGGFALSRSRVDRTAAPRITAGVTAAPAAPADSVAPPAPIEPASNVASAPPPPPPGRPGRTRRHRGVATAAPAATAASPLHPTDVDEKNVPLFQE